MSHEHADSLLTEGVSHVMETGNVVVPGLRVTKPPRPAAMSDRQLRCTPSPSLRNPLPSPAGGVIGVDVAAPRRRVSSPTRRASHPTLPALENFIAVRKRTRKGSD